MATPMRVAPPPPPIRKGQVVAVEALHNYKALRKEELTIEEGDLLFILDQTDDNWWLARLEDKEGFVPSNHVSHSGTRVPTIEEARRGNINLLRQYLTAGVSSNALDKSGSSALHAAAQGGHLECVQALLDTPGTQINLQNKMGDTPLHCASYRGHDQVVTLLLSRGAMRDLLNKDSCTPRDLVRRPSVQGIFDKVEMQARGGAVRISSYGDDEYGDADDSD